MSFLGVVLGFLAWFAVRYILTSFYTVDQNERAVKTSFGRADYGGPCPPSGEHRYFFKLYALDIPLPDPGLSKDQLLKSMEGHILAQGELVGVYRKQ